LKCCFKRDTYFLSEGPLGYEEPQSSAQEATKRKKRRRRGHVFASKLKKGGGGNGTRKRGQAFVFFKKTNGPGGLEGPAVKTTGATQK